MVYVRRDSVDYRNGHSKSALLISVENMHMRMVGIVDAGRSGGDFGLVHCCVPRFLKTSLFNLLILSRKKRQIAIFFYSPSASKHKHSRAPIQERTSHALSLSAVTHLRTDPQRQKRQRHGVEVLGLHLGHFGALETVLIRRFALDG